MGWTGRGWWRIGFVICLGCAGAPGGAGGTGGVGADRISATGASPTLGSGGTADTVAPDPTGGEGALPPFLPTGPAQRAQLCARAHADPVHDAYCSGQLDAVTDIGGLYQALGLQPAAAAPYGTPVVLTGHSTALLSRGVSAINPRLIVLDFRSEASGESEPPLLAVAFTRGDQIVEFITRDRDSGQLHLYLLTYAQACNATREGCGPGDLLTPETERGWRELSLYDEIDLENTPLDCLSCHEPGGPGTPRILRIQEDTNPWTHWFWKHGRGGQALLADYVRAKGQEAYAGVPYAVIAETEPSRMSTYAARHGSAEQPNAFDSTRIEREVVQSVPAQPMDNSTPGQSATWETIYAAAATGAYIPVPYHDVKITDPGKLDAMAQAYTDYREGRLPAAELPDIRDVLPDDPARLARMGMLPDPSLTGAELLRAACGRCHDGRATPTLGRARFDVARALSDPEMRAEALDRLRRPADATDAMPPPRVAAITEAQRAALIALFEGN